MIQFISYRSKHKNDHEHRTHMIEVLCHSLIQLPYLPKQKATLLNLVFTIPLLKKNPEVVELRSNNCENMVIEQKIGIMYIFTGRKNNIAEKIRLGKEIWEMPFSYLSLQTVLLLSKIKHIQIFYF